MDRGEHINGLPGALNKLAGITDKDRKGCPPIIPQRTTPRYGNTEKSTSPDMVTIFEKDGSFKTSDVLRLTCCQILDIKFEKEDANALTIELFQQRNDTMRGDVPLKLVVDSKKGIIETLWKKRNGEWKKFGEAKYQKKLKVRHIRIENQPQTFSLFCNWSFLGQFDHQINLSRTNAVVVAGEFNNLVGAFGGGKLQLPVVYGLRVKIGSTITIFGGIPMNSEDFTLNLFYGEDIEKSIALHINPRLIKPACVELNTFSAEKWDTKETVKMMPFTHKSAFEIVVHVGEEAYTITINGATFHKFSHRVDPTKVTAIEINGGVQVSGILCV